MRLKKINIGTFVFPFFIDGIRDGEESKEKQLLLKLNFSPEQLEKLNSGEMSLEDAVKSYTENFENNVRSRIQSEVEEKKKKEIFLSVYSKNEKLIAEAFGLDYEKYKDLEQAGRTSKILSDAKEKHENTIKELKNTYSSADQNKIKEVEDRWQKMLDENKALLEKAIKEKEELNLEWINKWNGREVSDYTTSNLKGLENAALSFEQMDAIIKAKQSEYSIVVEEKDGEKVGYMTKDGQKITDPKRPNENLTYSNFLLNTTEEFGFIKQSNGTDNPKQFILKGGEKTELQKKGLNPKFMEQVERVNKGLDE